MTTKGYFGLACWGGSLLLALASVPVMAQQAGGSAVQRQDATNDLSVVVGRSILLDCAQPVERVAIGLGDYAEATVITPTEVMVNGKAAGETSLILWERGGSREFFNITVRASLSASSDNLESIRRELRRELPGQTLTVSMDGPNVFLRGTVKDLNSSDRAVQIASVSGKVVNLLNVEVPKPQPQILLKVIFASVDRTRSKELGVNLFSTGYGNVIGGVNTSQFSPPVLGTATGTASIPSDLNIFAFLPGLNLGATIQAMESKGLVEVLAEPNILAQDGKQGSLLAGGEYPYPVVQAGTGSTAPTVTIQFKEYGIRLNFIPTITPQGTIRLQVAPEVSSLDFSNGIEISGFDVPAIDVRRVKTEVELGQGQSFAIGGLLDNRETETFQKIPYISSIPILGKFFQSINRSKTNTELIVIVTPEIVQPIPSGTPPPALNYPQPFLSPNSNIPMHTPENTTAVAPPVTAPIPVEKLQESMKPEKPLVVEGSMNPGSSGGSSSPQ